MRTITRRASLLGGALLAASCAPAASHAADVTAIEALMRATWDRPEARLDAGPIAVAHDYAVADWTQGDAGGRALLRKRDDAWRVILCSGDALRSAEGLAALGVAEPTAARLSRDLLELEREVDAERLAKMSRFAGIIRME